MRFIRSLALAAIVGGLSVAASVAHAQSTPPNPSIDKVQIIEIYNDETCARVGVDALANS